MFSCYFYDVVAPTVVITGHMNYNESDTAFLECEVITFPSPNITWIKRDQNIAAIIVNSQRTNITFTYSLQSLERPTAISRLMLTSVSSSDSGTYSCHVSTDIPGFYAVSSQITINVHGKPYILNIMCIIMSFIYHVTEINECETSNPCQNGGMCIDIDKGYTCVCSDLHTGQNCTQGNYVVAVNNQFHKYRPY